MWFSSSAGVSTSLSSMKSTSSACSTSASEKCPMRTLAITGMVTVFMISRITLMAAIRATPPSLRMSEGTRSSAITAQAPAFSAIRACSALVTSMMTPPLSISAKPTFTRHSFEPLLPLPLPFTFFGSISLLLSLIRLQLCCETCRLPKTGTAMPCPYQVAAPHLMRLFAENYEASAGARQQNAIGIANLAPLKQIATALRRLECFDGDFLVHADGLDEVDIHLRGDRAGVAEAADLAHRFIEQHGDDSAMQISAAALIARSQREFADDAAVHIVLLERQQHAVVVVSAATEALVFRVRIETDDVGFAHVSSLRRHAERHSSTQTNATRLRSARRTPRWRLRISMRSNSARMVTPRAICFSSRPAKPKRSVFGSGFCT